MLEGRFDAAVDWLVPEHGRFRQLTLFEDSLVAMAQRPSGTPAAAFDGELRKGAFVGCAHASRGARIPRAGPSGGAAQSDTCSRCSSVSKRSWWRVSRTRSSPHTKEHDEVAHDAFGQIAARRAERDRPDQARLDLRRGMPTRRTRSCAGQFGLHQMNSAAIAERELGAAASLRQVAARGRDLWVHTPGARRRRPRAAPSCSCDVQRLDGSIRSGLSNKINFLLVFSIGRRFAGTIAPLFNTRALPDSVMNSSRPAPPAVCCRRPGHGAGHCARAEPRRRAAEEPVLNLYSARHYHTDEALYDNFTKATGIKINRIDAGDDALLERIRSEGANSPADVLLIVDASRLWSAQQQVCRAGPMRSTSGSWCRRSGR